MRGRTQAGGGDSLGPWAGYRLRLPDKASGLGPVVSLSSSLGDLLGMGGRKYIMRVQDKD